MLDEDVVAQLDRKAQRVAQTRTSGRIGYTDAAATLARQVQAAENAEGALIAHSIAAALAQRTRLDVMQDVTVPLSREALILAAAANGADPSSELRNIDNGTRTQVDLLTYDPWFKEVVFYEIKRGAAPIGANHRRLRRLEHVALGITGAAYVEDVLGEPVVEVATRVISYYGRTGFDDATTVTAPELDACFGVAVRSEVEAHLACFRYKLDCLIPGLTGAVYPPLAIYATNRCTAVEPEWAAVA